MNWVTYLTYLSWARLASLVNRASEKKEGKKKEIQTQYTGVAIHGLGLSYHDHLLNGYFIEKKKRKDVPL